MREKKTGESCRDWCPERGAGRVRVRGGARVGERSAKRARVRCAERVTMR